MYLTAIKTFCNAAAHCLRSVRFPHAGCDLVTRRKLDINTRSLSSSAVQKLPLPADIDDVVRCDVAYSIADPVFHGNNNGLELVNTEFRAEAEVHVTGLAKGEIWEVGFVQAVKYSQSKFEYGKYGHATISLPELESGDFPMISDSDSDNFPWYDKNAGRVVLRGPINNESFMIETIDYPGTHVPWDLPHERHKGPPTSFEKLFIDWEIYEKFDGRLDEYFTRNLSEARLTKANMHIELYTWLIVHCQATGRFEVLDALKWKAISDVEVDCSETVGRRGTPTEKNISSSELVDDIAIPDSVFCKYFANNASEVAFYPDVGDKTPVILLPAMRWELPSDSTSTSSDSTSISDDDRVKELGATENNQKADDAGDSTVSVLNDSELESAEAKNLDRTESEFDDSGIKGAEAKDDDCVESEFEDSKTRGAEAKDGDRTGSEFDDSGIRGAEAEDTDSTSSESSNTGGANKNDGAKTGES